MVTRFRFPEDTITAPITPAADASWADTSILARRSLVPTTKATSGLADVVFPDDGDNTNKNILFRQLISPELVAGQTFTGGQSWRVQCRVLEPDSANNMFLTVGLRIIAGDGSTVQKTPIPVTRDATEAPSAGTLTNRAITGTTAATNYTTQSGDRLVLELGMGGDPGGSGTHASTMRLGSANVNDLGTNDTDTTDLAPWLELTDTLSFVETTVTKTIGTSSRDYSTITSWEAAINNTMLPTPNSCAVGECYADADFGESPVLDAMPSHCKQIVLKPAAGEQHTGVANTGVRILSGASGVALSLSRTDIIVDGMEIDKNGYNNSSIAQTVVGSTAVVKHCLIHGSGGTVAGQSGIAGPTNGISTFINNIIYNLTNTSAFGNAIAGISHVAGTGCVLNIHNNTIHDMTCNTGTGACTGILRSATTGSQSCQNNVVTSTGGTTSGTILDYSGAGGTTNYNLSSDTSAAGANSLISKAASDQFVSIVGGSEDLHLKSGADAIGAGTDLGTTPTGVNIDIDGDDRDALAVTWDMGADQLVSASAFTATADLSVGAATLAADAEFDAPVYAGAASLTAGPATLAAAATFAPATFTGTAALATGSVTLEASAAFTAPVYAGTASLVIGAAAFASDAVATPPTYTGEASLLVGAATLTGSAEFSAGTKTGTADLTAGPVVLTAAATFSPGTKTATASLLVGAVLLDGAAAFAPGTKTATASLLVGEATLSGSAEFDVPVYAGTAALAAGAVILAAAGLFAAEIYQGEAVLEVGAATLAASGEFDVPVYTGTAAFTTGAVTLDAAATFVGPTYTGAAPLLAGATTLAASATFAAPVDSATAALLVGSAVLTAAAAVDAPVYTGTAALPIGAAVLAASATYDHIATATADLTTPAATLSGEAALTPGTKTATADLLIGAAILTATVETQQGPTITAIADMTVTLGTDPLVIEFTVDDRDTPLEDLVLTVTSDNTLLVPESYLTLGGSGGSRTLTVRPVPGRTGVTTITVTVVNAADLETDEEFEYLVEPGTPTAHDDVAHANQHFLVAIDVLENDRPAWAALNPATLRIVSGPNHGTVRVGRGAVFYQADEGFAGVDSFRYTVRDVLDNVSNEATVTIYVAIPGRDGYQSPRVLMGTSRPPVLPVAAIDQRRRKS